MDFFFSSSSASTCASSLCLAHLFEVENRPLSPASVPLKTIDIFGSWKLMIYKNQNQHQFRSKVTRKKHQIWAKFRANSTVWHVWGVFQGRGHTSAVETGLRLSWGRFSLSSCRPRKEKTKNRPRVRVALSSAHQAPGTPNFSTPSVVLESFFSANHFGLWVCTSANLTHLKEPWQK